MHAVVFHGPVQTRRFSLGQAMEAYDTFARAGETNALKVTMTPEQT